MFKSIEYLRYDDYNYIYKLVDDDFEIETYAVSTTTGDAVEPATRKAAAAIKVYLSKSYTIEQIGENYALYILWTTKNDWTTEELINYQDEYLPMYYPEYKDIYQELKQYRDKYIQLFTIFQ